MSTEKNISEMSIDELEDYREDVRASKIAIDNALTQARARKTLTGEYSSANWYCQQTLESRRLYGLYERINKEIRFKKRVRNDVVLLSNFFMDIAREELDPEVFDSILKKAEVARSQKKEVLC